MADATSVILIVEDREDDVLVMRKAFKRAGLKTVANIRARDFSFILRSLLFLLCVPSGAIALVHFASGRIQLVQDGLQPLPRRCSVATDV